MNVSVGESVVVLDGKWKGKTGVVRYVNEAARCALVVTPDLAPFDVRVPLNALRREKEGA